MPLSALPALDIEAPFDPYSAIDEVRNFETKQSLLPSLRANAQTALDVEGTDLANTQLAQAAQSALAVDPDQAPAAWDASFSKLAQAGVKGASQYIGRYSPDLASKVESAFSKSGGGAGASSQAQQLSPQQLQMIAQTPPDKLQATVNTLNSVINGFNKGVTKQAWDEEVAKLKAAGIPNIPNTGNWQRDYSEAYKQIMKFMPVRDAMQQQLTMQALGIPQAPMAHDYKVVGNNVFDATTSKFLQAPTTDAKEPWDFIGADKTGGRGVFYNKSTSEWYDPSTGQRGAISQNGPQSAVPPAQQQQQMQQAYAPIVAKLIQSESGGNPLAKNANSSASGLSGAIDKTWINAARQAVPGADKMTDQQIVALKTDPRFPGLSSDITSQIAQSGAAELAANNMPVTGATIAMAYKLGAPTAQKVLNARDPNTPMSAILGPKASSANPQWAKMNVLQFRAAMQQQFGNNPISTQDTAKSNSPFGNADQQAEFELRNPDPKAQEILGQTGLDYPTFMVLTGSGSQLARDKATRSGAMKEATDFAKKRGIDVSTFKSQYQAYNDILQKNIARQNNTKVMEDELLSTIQNFKPAANDATISNVNAANAAAIWAGNQTNGPVSQEYNVYIHQLRNELAGYNAALAGRGQTQITDHDMHEAETTIKNGLNSVGASGLEKALINSTNKMNPVMERAVDRANQEVWRLFGVGEKYRPIYPQSYAAGVGGIGGGQQSNIPSDAVKRLKSNPKEAAQFDAVFGKGAAQKVLSGG